MIGVHVGVAEVKVTPAGNTISRALPEEMSQFEVANSTVTTSLTFPLEVTQPFRQNVTGDDKYAYC